MRLLSIDQKKVFTKDNLVLLFFILLYIANPFISIWSAYFYIITQNSVSDKFIKLNCVLLALFIGCINTTMYPYTASDLGWYLVDYLRAGNTSLWDYLMTSGRSGAGKEVVFPIFNYIIYSLVGPNKVLYIIIYSTVCYTFLNLAIYKFAKYFQLSSLIIISTIFIMTFTPYIFNLSINLLRQFLAGSILLYILVEILFYHKRCWLWMVCMVLIHTSAIFFVPLIFIPFFKRKITKKTWVFYILGAACVLASQSIAKAFLPFLSENNAIGNAVSRLALGTTYELDPLTPFKVAVSVMIAVLPQILIYKNDDLKDKPSVLHFFNILLILVLYVIVSLDQTEMSVRFNTYVWLFAPFSICLILYVFKLPKIIYFFIAIGIFCFFVYYLDHAVWKYTVGRDMYTNSLLHYM